MTEQNKCPECGGAVLKEAPFGHCPTCMLRCGADPPPPPELKSGGESGSRPHRLGDFELIAELGCGGMGVVYKARQVSLNRLVALKMISPGAFGTEELVDRFLQEAQLAGSLQHPNIVSIYSVGDFEGQPHICMELVLGTRLDQHITKQGFVWSTGDPKAKHRDRSAHAPAVRLIAKVAQALHHAHQHGVIHRDIKPSNILLDAAGEPHLTDFGLAKLLGPGAARRTAAGAILGTPCYMAPEQASGETDLISTAADVYSMGALLYEMLTGHPPFRGRTPVETIHRLVNEEPKHPTTLNGSVDPDLATICLKCLEKAPKGRYDSADALAQDLERWLRKEPIEARPVGSVGKTWRWCRREPALAGLIGGVFLLLLVLLVVMSNLWRQEKRRGDETKLQVRKAARELIENKLLEWEKPETTSIQIRPEEVDILLRRPRRQEAVLAAAPKVVLGITTSNVRRYPEKILEAYAALLDYLGTNTVASPMRLHLTIFKQYTNAVAAVRRGEVHLLRLSPVAYLSAQRDPRGLTLLVQEELEHLTVMHTAIVASTNAGIRGWTEARGKMLFTLERDLLPDDIPVKAFLFDQGLRALDFAQCVSFADLETMLRQARTNTLVLGAAAQNAIEDQLRGWKQLEMEEEMEARLRGRKRREKAAPLTLLATNLSSATFPWVVGTQLAPKLAQALKQSLCSLTNPSVLVPLLGSPTGFRATRREDFDAFAEQLRKASLFDGPAK